MRIPHWPALICGWVLAAMIGQPVLAAGPDDDFSAASALTEAGDDSGPYGDSGGLGMPYQPTEFAEGGVYGGYGAGIAPPAGGYNAPGMPAQNAWPETSPFTQHRIQETYNEGGLWNYNSDDNFNRKYDFSIEYLLAHSAKPGGHLIGAPQFRADDFFQGFPQVFPQQTTALYNDMFHGGIRLRYGVENPDLSGMALSGFWFFKNTQDNYRFISVADPNNIFTLLTRAAIVLDNGDGTSTTVPFDSAFRQNWSQTVGGADFNIFSQPFFQRHTLKLGMTYGVKYLRISEQFSVAASDSGLGYIVLLPSGAIDYSTVTFIGIAPYTTRIASWTNSDLVGPQAGLKYELGGDKLKFWGTTQFALAADIERVVVTGSNVVQGFQVGAVTAPPTRHSRSTTHIAPVFDTSINMDIPIFAMIPLVNRLDMFRTANLRIGYNLVYAWEIARAVSSIKYSFGDPQIQNGRTTFQYNSFNFGIDWKW